MPDSNKSIDAWAAEYITSTSLLHKLSPPEVPATFAKKHVLVPSRPGRPEELEVVDKAKKSPRSCRTIRQRAQLMHTFFHHELQAAELMCWAILRFPNTPEPFRRGLLRIALDEVRHCGLYAGYLDRVGFPVGSFVVKDWFWQRIPACATPLSFVACMGVGFEGANLDHAARFAAAFEEHGDVEGAAIQQQVGREEIAHVRFAANWFREFSGREVEFERWENALPAPLSPMVMRGAPMNAEQREAAGLDATFRARLSSWKPRDSTESP